MRLVTGGEKWIVYKKSQASGLGNSAVNNHNPLPKRSFSRKGQYGGIPKVFCISSSYQAIKLLIQPCTASNWTNWKIQLIKRGQNLWVVKALCFTKTLQEHTWVWYPAKSCWSLVEMCCLTYHTFLILNIQIPICFVLCRIPWIIKHSNPMRL